MAITILKTPFVAALIAIVGIVGCATPGGGLDKTASAETGECNPGIAAAAGAIIGALIGGGNNRVRGAALGAGLASLACVGWNYNVRQTKSAEQVQEEYKAANSGELPTESTVVRYDTRFDPTAYVTRGGKMTVVSNIEVIQGTSDSNLIIEEELTLVRPDKSEVKSRKRANANQSTGGFATTYSMTMPQGVPQGVYPVRTALYVNGKQVAEKDMQMQVVRIQNGDILAGWQD